MGFKSKIKIIIIHFDLLFIFDPFFYSSLPLSCSVSEIFANELRVLVSMRGLLSLIQLFELLLLLQLLFQCFFLPKLRVLHWQNDWALEALLVQLRLLFLLDSLVLSLLLIWVTVLNDVGFLDHVSRFSVSLWAQVKKTSWLHWLWLEISLSQNSWLLKRMNFSDLLLNCFLAFRIKLRLELFPET